MANSTYIAKNKQNKGKVDSSNNPGMKSRVEAVAAAASKTFEAGDSNPTTWQQKIKV